MGANAFRAGRTGLAALALVLLTGAAEAKVTGLVHRGGRVHAPENTLPTFAHTLSIGNQWMETDSWSSADGIPILHHDVSLCRTTNIEDWGYDCVVASNNPLGRFPRPGDFTVAQLQQLDAGSWFDPAFAGTPMPTLEEALLLVDGSGLSLVVEIKNPGQTLPILDIFQRTGIDPDTLIVWTRQQIMNPEFRQNLPNVRRIVGGYAAADLTDPVLQELAANGDFGVGILTNTITQAVVDRAHAHGLFVYGYPGPTGNMPLLTQIGIGVDGVNYIDPEKWVFQTLPTLPCVDGVDNDGDGRIDFGGLDEDFDGNLEALWEITCKDRLGSSEVGQCQDGADNDGDGLIDYPADPQCSADWDDTEAPEGGCGLLGLEALLVVPLLRAARRRRRTSRRR